ncbi:MAG: hypothetical protein HC834_06860, partial [Rhodospirillales bacterium]|nr:hypothetical protein [Rhodospirillales bacterium]
MSTEPKATLELLLHHLGFAASVEELPSDDGILLNVKSEDAERLIGRGGQVLADLQYLTNRLLFQQNPDAPKVTVDIDGYRAKAQQALVTKAVEAAEKATRLGDIVEPMTTMRRAIANHMLRSQSTSAHAYTVFEMDMTAMMNLRARCRERFEAEYGCKLTPLAFITRAVVEGLIQFPVINASTDEHQNILYHRRINVGIAVALPNNGLLNVVSHDADT